MSSYLQVICFIKQHVPHLIWNDLIAGYLSEFWTSSKAIDCNASIPPLSKRQLYQECYAPDDLKWLNQLNQYFYGKKTFLPSNTRKSLFALGDELQGTCTAINGCMHTTTSHGSFNRFLMNTFIIHVQVSSLILVVLPDNHCNTLKLTMVWK